MMAHQYFGITKSFLIVMIMFMAGPAVAFSEGDVAPDWTLTGSADADINYYEDSADNVSVLLFWATWCPYCRMLMPHLQIVAHEFRDAPVRFYALNIWEDGDPKAYLNKHAYTFSLLLTADLVAGDYGVKGTPGLFVVDRTHRVIYMRRSGDDPQDVENAVREAVQSALKSH